MSETKTLAQLQTENERLIAANVALTKILSTAKIIKETSDYFCTSDESKNIAYKSLSETKKHFESKCEYLLKAMLKVEKKDAYTSEQFHNALTLIVAESLKVTE